MKNEVCPETSLSRYLEFLVSTRQQRGTALALKHIVIRDVRWITQCNREGSRLKSARLDGKKVCLPKMIAVEIHSSGFGQMLCKCCPVHVTSVNISQWILVSDIDEPPLERRNEFAPAKARFERDVVFGTDPQSDDDFCQRAGV